MNRIAGLILLTLGLSTTASAAELLDRIIAVVDEDVITAIEFEQQYSDIRKQLQKTTLSTREQQALRKQVLDKLIRDRIQIQMADKLNIKIDDVTLNSTLERLATANNLSLDGLRQTLEDQGIPYQRFREQTRSELIMKQLQQRMVANRVTVSDQEIDQFIADQQKQADANARFKLRHILIATSSTASPEEVQSARERAEEIYQRIQQGEVFADLAVQESSGRNALEGGDLGWRESSALPGSFVTALGKIEKGEATTPIRSASGFHLLYLEDTSRAANTVIQTFARHILIKQTDDNSPQQTLTELRERLVDGADFASLAGEFSEDPGSKDKGGELGWADPGTFVPAFESAMAPLKDGEISEPFESQFGWHIVQVMERRESSGKLDSQVREARQSIRARKIDEQLRLWLQKIRDEAYVEIIAASDDSNN